MAGPPDNYLDTPSAVVQIQRHLHKMLEQYPNWWRNPAQVKIISSLRAKMRAAWEIAEVEKALQIAPIASLCVIGAPAPSKAQYRIVRRQADSIRVEPTYVAGVTPPTALLGAIGIDRFRQRHLAPPWYMEKEHMPSFAVENHPHPPHNSHSRRHTPHSAQSPPLVPLPKFAAVQTFPHVRG